MAANRGKADNRGKASGHPSAEDDLALWLRVTRDAKPLRRAQRPSKPAAIGPKPAGAAAPPKIGAALPPAVARAPGAAMPALSADASPGVDSRTSERLRRGLMAIDARLDLHGHTQEEAHRALIAFVELAWRRGSRCLLVITGKGQPDKAGVLRQAVPRWLNEPPLRPRILAFATAQPKDGGAGALYLLLKRQRSNSGEAAR